MYLSLDYGNRYIGIAATDSDGRIPYRYGVIDQKNQDPFNVLAEIIAKEHVTHILVGVPISLDGNETEQTHKTLEFIEKLRAVVDPDIDIEGVDETLTSIEAQQVLRHEGGDPKQEHSEAARLILSDYLKTVA
ncbi:MAG: Holliday junction resolvase RuvX [Candidatus Andersenbacteria bacterium]